MRPSEQIIVDRINKACASPGGFQRIVESYIQIKFPSLFRDIAPLGRNLRDSTVPGWPDAYSLTQGARYAALEVTAGDALEHLKEDLQRLTADVTTFVFVAWRNDPRPETLTSVLRGFAPATMNHDQIYLIFKKQLVRDLTHPYFAPIWIELDIPISSAPFSFLDPIHDTPGADHLFGSRSGALFSPSRDEYKVGSVHAPDLYEQLVTRLEKEKWALVHGRGAAGKTVLALQIAFSGMYRSIYYLALEADFGDLLLLKTQEVLISRAAERTLFILDDVHLQPRIAAEFRDIWEATHLGSSLLLLGRLSTPGPHARGVSAALDRFSHHALLLEVKSRDLVGVVDRLMRRQSRPPLAIPAEAVNTWHRLFGGDLLAFSAAVLRRMTQFKVGNWGLKEGDSREYVLETYLDNGGMSREEREDLIIIATFAEIELSTPAEALRGVPTHSLQSGLVLKRVAASGSVRYSLVHPGMGKLLTAADQRNDQRQILIELSKKVPFLGVQAVTRLLALEHIEDAQVVVSGAFDDDPISFYTCSLSHSLTALIDSLSQLGSVVKVSFPELDVRLQADETSLNEAVFRTGLSHLIRFFEYSFKILPRTASAVLDTLNSKEGVEYIQTRAIEDNAGELGVLIRFAHTSQGRLWSGGSRTFTNTFAHQYSEALLNSGNLEDVLGIIKRWRQQYRRFADQLLWHLRRTLFGDSLVQLIMRTELDALLGLLRTSSIECPWLWERLSRVLQTPDTTEIIRSKVLSTPLGASGAFINYAADNLPQLHKSLAHSLLNGEAFQNFETRLWASQTGQVTGFLSALKSGLPELHQQLVSTLSSKANREHLLTNLSDTPIGELVGFMRYVRAVNPELERDIFLFFSDSEQNERLLKRLHKSTFAELRGFLQIEPEFLRSVLEHFNSEEWWRNQYQRGEGILAYPVTAKIAELTTRNEVLKRVLECLIAGSDLNAWKAKGVGLWHLGYVIHSGFEIDKLATRQLVEEVATPQWLAFRYQQDSFQAIAASLYRIWVRADVDLHHLFVTDALLTKVADAFSDGNQNDPTAMMYAIELLGSASLFCGIEVDWGTMGFPGYKMLNSVLREWLSVEGNPVHYEIQLVLGLRELARLCSEPIFVEYSLGSELIRRWEMLDVQGERETMLQQFIITWLTACSKAKWYLVAEAQLASAILSPLTR
jgi:hypothetical protein